LLVAVVLALGANLYTLRTASGVIRSYSSTNRAALAAIELARRQVASDFIPATRSAAVNLAYLVEGGAGPVLQAVDRNGSFAFSLAELREQPEGVREIVDSTLAAALDLSLEPAASGRALTGCRRLRPSAAIALRPPGVVLRAAATEQVKLGRFADVPTADVGSLRPGTAEVLQIPGDHAREPWHVNLSPGGPVTVCALPR
jgi:hypothetical protein